MVAITKLPVLFHIQMGERMEEMELHMYMECVLTYLEEQIVVIDHLQMEPIQLEMNQFQIIVEEQENADLEKLQVEVDLAVMADG